MLTITVAQEDDAAAWAQAVIQSNDGTLHHDLSFLAYHPRGRFTFEHLILRNETDIVAIVPGGIVEREGIRSYLSPQGASVGGPILMKPSLAESLSVVESLQHYANERGWNSLEFVLGPSAYQRERNDTMSFALFSRGFQLIERDLSFLIPIEPGAVDSYATLFRKKQAWGVRAAQRRGVLVTHGGLELSQAFFTLFRETYERHGTPATHSEAEINDLLTRLPGRIEITLAAREDVPLAGILVFRLNDRAAQTFYICSSTEHSKENGTVAAIAGLIDRLAASGVRFLDLGPSASSKRINGGVAFFKEGLGATGQVRDRWKWNPRPN